MWKGPPRSFPAPLAFQPTTDLRASLESTSVFPGRQASLKESMKGGGGGGKSL